MSFPQGVYSIVSKRTTGTMPDLIGRFVIEDLSLLPKPIFALPDGIRPNYPHWLITPKGNGLEIRASGAVVGVDSRNNLRAFLLDGMMPKPASWIATPTGDGAYYTIELSDRSAGWVVSDEDSPRGYPVDIKPLSGSKKDTELFTITRLDESN